MPEGIILVNTQSTRNADTHTGLFFRNYRAFEQQIQLLAMLINAFDKRIGLVGIDFFAVITCIKSISIGEHQFFHLAMILAARACFHLHSRGLGSNHIGQRKHLAVRLAVSGIQSRAVGTHQLWHIREEHTLARHQFQGTHNRQVLERSSLYHYMFAQFTDILYFKNFV